MIHAELVRDDHGGDDGFLVLRDGSRECATIGDSCRKNGDTFWVGKDHNVPEEDNAPGGSRSMWPLQLGFDRFYGFLGGETNNWYPDLVEDNRFIEAPATPEEGYHLSKDLATRRWGC